MLVITQPGYTDAYYYVTVAERLALGHGLSADFVWNFLEAPPGSELPVPSHRFWMPLATLIQAAGIALVGGIVGSFGAAQLAIVAVAAAIPAVAYAAARALATGHRAAMVTAAIAGLGGALAPAWVSLDSFAPAAVIGTLFFLLYRRAAAGDVRAGALAGLCVGLLYLARAEGALFGVALLALRSRAGLSGAAVALLIGATWQLRQLSLGYPDDLFARAALLVRYEDFFRLAPPTLEAYLAQWPAALQAKADALVKNAQTFALAFAFLLLPGIVVALRAHLARPEVRAWAGLALLVFLAQSLIWTLHSTRGSYFHSLAALFPFGVALAIAGSRRWRPTVTVAALAGIASLSVVSVGLWDRAFDPPAAARAAAAQVLPPGRILVIDAAAWRWLSGREAIVTPAEGLSAAGCGFARLEPRVLVLEPVHFSAYDERYRTGEALVESGSIRVFEHRDACRVAGR